jgi:hypothetical protein
VQHVDPAEAEPLEALLDRAQDAVIAEIEDRVDGADAWPALETAGELAVVGRGAGA